MEWIDFRDRIPKEGEHITLEGVRGIFEVHGQGLYDKGRLMIPISIVEKYKVV